MLTHKLTMLALAHKLLGYDILTSNAIVKIFLKGARACFVDLGKGFQGFDWDSYMVY